MKLKFASVKKSEYCCYDPRNGNGTDINTKVCSSMTKRPADGEHSLHGNDSKCINGRCSCKHVNKVENTPCCYWSWFKCRYEKRSGQSSNQLIGQAQTDQKKCRTLSASQVKKNPDDKNIKFPHLITIFVSAKLRLNSKKKRITKKNNYNSNDDESHQNGLWIGLLRQMKLEHLEICFYVHFSASYWLKHIKICLTRDWNVDREMSNNCILTDFEKQSFSLNRQKKRLNMTFE